MSPRAENTASKGYESQGVPSSIGGHVALGNERNALPEGRVLWRGRLDYVTAWREQQDLAERRRAGAIPDTLLLLEHPPTITLGRSAKPEHILQSVEALEREGFAVVATDRGGDVTYHGPGQLVGYPILDLNAWPHRPDLHAYLRDLESVLIRALAHFGVAGDRFRAHTGVWTGTATPAPEKIAAIGVKASRWITQHGFALNVAPDLSHFERIIPCGIHDYGVTSLARVLNRPVALAEVAPIVANAFGEIFRLDCHWQDAPPSPPVED